MTTTDVSNSAIAQSRADASAVRLTRISARYGAEARARLAWSRDAEAHRYQVLALGYARAAAVLLRHDREHAGAAECCDREACQLAAAFDAEGSDR